MTIYVKIMPNLTGPLVVVLLYDGLCTFEFGIAAEVFGLARPEMGPAWYRFASCAVDEGPMRAHGGLVVVADSGPELIEQADIVIVPGWKGADVPVPDTLCRQLRAAHERGARLASICSGAFVLAATGLLSGGAATTHWRYADRLRARYPDIAVDDASLYRSHNRIYTSAGSAAGIDLMIDIVRQDFGASAANSVARRLVMPAHRSGGQAQFLERPVPHREGLAIAPLLENVRANLAANWSVERMAGECRMSVRTFLRRFSEATGQTPGDWLLSERVSDAQRLLCLGQSNMEVVALASGFGSAHTLRHHFRKRIGISPSEYRARFISEQP
ncbi:transcriptional regulator FtrA [Rhizobium sp. BK251]|uniref:transcriptional regulator FtrA n=1 Tax=Rhizobium sp. BK251 TaxID=2512125 RepID=UPI00104394DD|nr:transcriptional regulator FtrA [Rhizobium sp. BK251]TCL72592.1 AraC family transcriptional regulator with amidase-like domain [Rhizobium sp. BK251]